MAEFKPDYPYTTPAVILVPTYEDIKGLTVPVFPDTGEQFFCTFKTFGGTESESNGTLVVLDTANVETWYRPDITSDCRIKLLDDGSIYEVIGQPEDVGRRHMWMRFKVQRVKGGA